MVGQQKSNDEEMDKRVAQVSSRIDSLHEHVNQVEQAIEVRHTIHSHHSS
jgi:hypothetical protein